MKAQLSELLGKSWLIFWDEKLKELSRCMWAKKLTRGVSAELIPGICKGIFVSA